MPHYHSEKRIKTKVPLVRFDVAQRNGGPVRPILPQGALDAEIAHIQNLAAATRRTELLACCPQGVDAIPLSGPVVPHDVAWQHDRCRTSCNAMTERIDEYDHILIIDIHPNGL